MMHYRIRPALSIALILFAALSLAGCSSGSLRKTDQPPSSPEKQPGIPRLGMLEAIMQMMSVPYRPEGSDLRGFDCSGFTSKIYGDVVHMLLPHSAAKQYALGREVGQDKLDFGDLVFFQLEGEGPTHVGIYVGDGLFAHASVSRGVTISLLSAEYYHNRLYGIRRIVE